MRKEKLAELERHFKDGALMSHETLRDVLELIHDYRELSKSACDALNEDAMSDRIHSNIEWQRNWCSRQLAELGISTPHPECDDPGAARMAEKRVQTIKRIICADDVQT